MSLYVGKTVKQLKDLLKSRGLNCHGHKADLINRLVDYDDVLNGQSNVVDDDEDVILGNDHDDDDDIVADNSQTHASSEPIVAQGESEAVKLLQLQIQLAQLHLEQAKLGASSSDQPVIDRIDLGSVKSRLPTMSDNCDVISYFVTLEKSFVINSVPKAKWAMLLPSLLSPRASKIFAQLSIETCQNYDETKTALLNAFKCNADSYLRKLQTERRFGQESYFMYLARLEEYQTLYLMSRKISNFEELKDEMLSIYFMSGLPDSVCEFVRTRQPKTSKECAEAADLFYAIKSRHIAHTFRGQKPVSRPNHSHQQNAQPEIISESKPNDAVLSNAKNVDKPQATGTEKATRSCWTCGSFDHVRANCTKGKSANVRKTQPKTTQPTCLVHDDGIRVNEKFMIPIYLGNSPKVRVGWRDTASSYSIIAAEHADLCQLTDRTVTVKGISGEPKILKIGMLALRSPHFDYDDNVLLTEVAILDTPLPCNVDILLGNLLYSKFPIRDCFDLRQSAGNSACQAGRDNAGTNYSDAEPVNVQMHQDVSVVDKLSTRPSSNAGDTRQLSIADVAPLQRAREQPAVSAANSSVEHVSQSIEARDQMTDATGQRHANESIKKRLTPVKDAQSVVTVDSCVGNKQPGASNDGQCVTERLDRDGTIADELKRLMQIDPSVINNDFFIPTTDQQKCHEFSRAQREDAKLQSAWQKVANGANDYVVRNGILFKKKPENIRSDNELLLVIPECYLQRVLNAAHDSVQAGCHFSVSKTFDKVRRIFDIKRSTVKSYVSACPVCQRLSPKRVTERAELVQVPIMGLEFAQKWVIDVAGGDLKRVSKASGNFKYILVCCDVATRWVELIPLPNLKAPTVSDALLTNIIARFGCETLVYDQASGFVSNLMQAVLKLLRIHSKIAIAGYHSATSQTERWIRTVQHCLKSYIFDYEGKWHTLLPWIAFNLRQVPCETLGFSSHELVFSRNLHSALDDLRDEFIGDIDKKEKKVRQSVLSYITELRNKLELSKTIAHEHASLVQSKTKTRYDKTSTPNKQFSVGQQVIILEPDDTRKLYARWSVPRKIVRRVNERNYEVELDDGRKKLFHVNQLRAWNSPVEFVNVAVVTADCGQNDEDRHLVAIEDSESFPPQFKVEMDLPSEQREKILALLNEYADTVFRPSLGVTHLVTHHIKLTDDTPCVSPPYRIPEALKKPFEEEINRLLAAGVLRPCQSSYRSGIIPIRKLDNSLRLVCDFKKLNSKTVPDLYEMPDARNVLSMAAGKKFVSKLDLSKSYFQIPLAEECQEYTSFSSFLGTFCWQRAAMGLMNSGRTMQRLMDSILRNTSKFAFCLIDDVIVGSETFESHLEHIREILDRFRAANLTASVSKSEFMMKSLTVFGHCLENGEIKPSQRHIEKILEIQPQTTKKGVRAILGLINYHSDMIPNLAEITFCLTELLKRDQPETKINWQPKHSEALQKIKQILCSKPVLVAPRHDKDFILMSDATECTIAAILAQRDDQGVERNVAYYSKKLSPRERNFSVIEKECCGILNAVLHWHSWLYQRRTLVRTDHAALTFLQTAARHNSRLARWHVILSNYDLDFEYRKGSLHANCDGLSRIEMPE